jgi:hypothetical protein
VNQTWFLPVSYPSWMSIKNIYQKAVFSYMNESNSAASHSTWTGWGAWGP